MPRVGRRAAPGPTPQEMPFDRSNCIGFSRAGQVSPTPNPSKSCQNAPKLSPLQPPQRVPKRQRRTPPPRGPPPPVTSERERAVARPGGRPGPSCSDATAGPGYRRFWAPPSPPLARGDGGNAPRRQKYARSLHLVVHCGYNHPPTTFYALDHRNKEAI